MGILGWSLTVAGLLAGLASTATIIGCFLPRGHVAARTLTLRQPPDVVWAVLRDGEGWAGWWDILKAVEQLPDKDGRPVWHFLYKDGNKFQIMLEEAAAPRRLVLRIDDESKLFDGSWSYAIAPADGGSAVTLTEDGNISNPFVRCMARLCMDPHMYIDMNLKALAAKFGETSTPR
jgi:hypothetical protein